MYKTPFNDIKSMKKAVSIRDKEESQKSLEKFKISSAQLLKDFETFKSERSEASETFRYWNNFIDMVHLLRDIVRADREGDWNLHLSSVKDTLPLFKIFDRTNYLRWCSMYVEDMQGLKESAPDVFAAFMEGKFSVKRNVGHFNSVGADMCLEQTINRSSKGKGGVVGETKRKEFFTSWNLVYHEMLGVTNLARELSGSQLDHRELALHHDDSRADIERVERNVQNMMEYIESKENPFSMSSEQRLHNILTQEIMSESIRDNLLNVFENGQVQFNQFRDKRFVERSEKISDTIHRNNIKTFKSIRKSSEVQKDSGKLKVLKRDMLAAQKIIDLARVRNFDDKKLFEYSLVPSCYLFDESGLMIEPNKSELVRELERIYLKKEDYVYAKSPAAENTTYLVDVMANLRKMNTKDIGTMGQLCQAFIDYILPLCNNAKQIHFVFDSYIDGSVKDSTRCHRYQSPPIECNMVNKNTPLPLDMSTFWTCNKNKEKLQCLLGKYILELDIGEVILSSYVTDGEIQYSSDKLGDTIEDLNLNIEEADVRLFPHAQYAIRKGCDRIVVLSNDADVIVGLIHHCSQFKKDGLGELWCRAGVATTTRFIPIHTLAERMGPELCDMLPAMHDLTGCDATSKVGTKVSGIKQLPKADLVNFGKDPRVFDVDDMLIKGENYLIQVIKPGSLCKSMDELRHDLYHHSKSKSFVDLPPTSFEIRGHCLRAVYNTYMYRYALCGEMPSLDPRDFGYEVDDNLLVPSLYSNVYPTDLIQPCNCKACATIRCKCRAAGISCCAYCKCSGKGDQCRNPRNPNNDIV